MCVCVCARARARMYVTHIHKHRRTETFLRCQQCFTFTFVNYFAITNASSVRRSQLQTHTCLQRGGTAVLENVSPDGKELSGSAGRLLNPGKLAAWDPDLPTTRGKRTTQYIHKYNTHAQTQTCKRVTIGCDCC